MRKVILHRSMFGWGVCVGQSCHGATLEVEMKSLRALQIDAPALYRVLLTSDPGNTMVFSTVLVLNEKMDVNSSRTARARSCFPVCT